MYPLIIEGCSATLHLPDAGVYRVVIMINTFGPEGAFAVRAWTALGEDLAAAGVALLRFDLPDQGDSRDLPQDTDAASAWLESIVAMVDWVRGKFAGVEIGMCGYRLGALLATQAASRISGLYGLSLVAPVVQGRKFVRELKLQTGSDGSGSGLSQEGWWLSAASLKTIAGWGLDQLDPALSPPTFVLADNGIRALEQWLGTAHPHQVQLCEELAKLRNVPHLVEVPESAFADLSQWWSQGLTATPTSGDRTGLRLDPASWPPQILSIEGGTEQPLRFGSDRHLPGTWCMPTREAVPRRSVLILSTGGNPRSGHGRLSTKIARALALEGVASLRIDCNGIGEAAPVLRAANHGLYRDTGFPDVKEALDEMQHKGWGQPVVFGLCSGAYLAYQSVFEDTRMSALILANLYTFQYQGSSVSENHTMPDNAPVTLKPVETYFNVILTRDFWRRLLGGHVNARPVISKLTATYGQRMALTILGELPDRIQLDSRGKRIRDRMRTLTEARVPLLFLYGDRHPGLNDLNTVFGKAGRRLTRHPWIEVELVSGGGYTFSSETSARHVTDRIVQFVKRLPAIDRT